MELTLFLDHQCNLRCTYCYNGRKFSRPMTTEVMRSAVDLALSLGPPHLDLGLFGGEPLLHFDRIRELDEYVTHALRACPERPPTVRWILNTNGTCFTEEILDWFSPPRRAAVFVSLDGDRSAHDRHRVDRAGQGSYDAVIQGLAALRQRAIEYRLVAVVSVDTAPLLGGSVRHLLDLGGAKVTLTPNLRDEWTEGSIRGLRAGLREAGAAWRERFRAGQPVALEPLSTKILSHLQGGIPCPSRCRIAGTELSVSPRGHVFPCAQMIGEDEDLRWVIGDVERGLDPDRILALQRQKDRVERSCRDCALRDRCQSHCGCRHLALTGMLGEITATLCEVESAFIDAADEVAESLYAEQCPAFVEFYYRRRWSPTAGSVLTGLRRSRDA